MEQKLLLSKIRNINRTQVFAFAAIIFTLVYMYQGWFGVTSPSFNRSIFIFFAVLLVIINKPLKGNWVILDYIAILAVIVSTVYFNTNYDRFLRSFGMKLEPMDIIMGTIMIILIIEAVRRQLGWLLAGLTIFALIYLVYGQHFPISVAHAGFNWETVVSEIYSSTHGMYGEITYVLANYMLLFLVFGSFLSLSGAGDFYLELAKSILGRQPGGAAKAAVLSSFIVGSVTGSAAGNVAITGAITIPLMKKSKYEAYVAGATEAVASTGGTILPPVMGAAAFIMSAITGRSYLDIIKIAAIPGVLYFCSIYLHTHFYALRRGLSGLPKEEVPRLDKILKEGIQFIIPLIVLIGSLIYGLSLNKVAMNSILAAFITSYFRKETRMSLNNILAALSQAGKTALPILAVAAPVSIISAALTLPGTAIRLSGSLVSLTDGNLLFLIVGVAAIGYILGMGLDATAAYMVMATFAPAAMANLGVPVLSAHLLALWYGQLSNITPPVAMASYVAATIAEANIWKVGMKAVVMGLALIYLPAVWVFRPELVLNGGLPEILITTLFTLFGIMLLVSGFEGYLFYATPLWLRALSILAAVMVLIPISTFDYLGLGLGFVVVVYQYIVRNNYKDQGIIVA